MRTRTFLGLIEHLYKVTYLCNIIGIQDVGNLDGVLRGEIPNDTHELLPLVTEVILRITLPREKQIQNAPGGQHWIKRTVIDLGVQGGVG